MSRRARFDVEGLERRQLLAYTFGAIPLSSPDDIGGISQPSKGNVYFTDVANNAIGKFAIADPNHPITEYPLTAFVQNPGAIVAAPNGMVFFGLNGALGSFDPTTNAIASIYLAAVVGPLNQAWPATPTQFALGGDGQVYFSDYIPYSFGGPRPLGSVAYQLESVDPTVPLTSASVTAYPTVVASAIAPEPDGDIAFIGSVNDTKTPAGGVGVFDVTSKTGASFAPPPGQLALAGASLLNGVYQTYGGLAVGPGGTLDFAESGAVGAATTSPRPSRSSSARWSTTPTAQAQAPP